MFRKRIEVFLLDNSGNRIAPGVVAVNPVPGSGIKLSTGEYQVQVEENQMYAITCYDGLWLFSITDKTLIDVNIEWICTAGKTIIIKIPENKNILYYQARQTQMDAYMRKLA